jgi:hypothetical protein
MISLIDHDVYILLYIQGLKSTQRPHLCFQSHDLPALHVRLLLLV